ncbi:MAG: magnesium transporter [Elusimicrobiales bacterium]|nr:magnesium transporter [Elusimicrobiales bacterium]
MVSPATLLDIITRFIETDPDRAALAIESLSPEEGAGVLRSLPKAGAALCLARLQHKTSARFLEHVPPRDCASLLSGLGSHAAADIVRRIPENKRGEIAAALAPAAAEKLRKICAWPPDSAGRLMRPDYTAFRTDITVEHAAARLRAMAKNGINIGYCYVVDSQDRLAGVINMRDMVLCEPSAVLKSIMRPDVTHVSPCAGRDLLTELFSVRHFLVLPVTDEDGRIIGVVAPDSLIETAGEKAGDDMQLLFGADADERVWSPLSFKITRRLPWLQINLLTACLAGAIVLLFEGLIGKIAALAVFLPVVLGQGGNAGVQSLSVVLRGIIMREVSAGGAGRLVAAEMLAGLVNGAAVGVVTGIGAWLWRRNAWFGFVAGLSMTITMVAAGAAGAGVPLLMRRLGIDPAHSSGIVVTTITDVIGIFAFLGLAWFFQAHLV